ncbi:hypothetical protein CC86DRAFT_292868, partial [Ophiobolus disseminans]
TNMFVAPSEAKRHCRRSASSPQFTASLPSVKPNVDVDGHGSPQWGGPNQP